MICNDCPRKCGVDRSCSVGFCSCNDKILISKYMLHHWEEPIISGSENDAGSGAIFFAGCNLKCVYCQNEDISFSPNGKTYSPRELADLFKQIEKMGALNINLVTPTHFLNQIIEAIKIYRPKIPIVWNSNGYETEEQIKKLKDYVDIYLVDLKYLDKNISKELSHAENYPEVAKLAIKTMKQNCPNDIIINGLMKKGVIIRHLVLPTLIENSFKCLDYIKEEFGEDQYISIMSQYMPNKKVQEEYKDSFLNRKLHIIEYKRVLNHLYNLNFKNGFIQDLNSSNASFVPDFSKFKD